MKTFLKIRIAFALAIMLIFCTLLSACTDEVKWQAISHKTYYNNQQIKVVAQKQNYIAVYDANVTAKSIQLGWRPSEDASWSSVKVYFDGIIQLAEYFVEEFIDGDNNLYHAVKIRKLTPTNIKLEVTYKPNDVQIYEYNLTDILSAINDYATEKGLNLF